MDYLEDYRKIIIEPLEDYRRNLIVKYEKTIFFKKIYEELLDKIEVELINKYQRYYDMSVEECEFQEYINKQLKS